MKNTRNTMNIAGRYDHSEAALFAQGPRCGEAFHTCRSKINIFLQYL